MATTAAIGEFAQSLVQTEGGLVPLALRVTLGVVIFAHGAQKLLGWFGGDGYQNTMNYFTKAMGIPAVLVFTLIMLEFFGALALIFGFLTKLVALGIGVDMLVAAWIVHRSNGFFMNWEGDQAGEGFEFHVIAIGIALALVISGGGALSLDMLLAGLL